MPSLPGIYYQPPPPFLGGRQPYEPRKLNPVFLDYPPPNKGGQYWVPSEDKTPWSFYAMQQRKLPAGLLNLVPDNPSFMHPAVQRAMQAIIATDWIPPPPMPFMGRKLPASLLNLVPNNPSFLHPGKSKAVQAIIAYGWVPAPPMPFMGRKLPASLLNLQPANPSFMHGGRRREIQAIIAQAWTPPAPMPIEARQLPGSFLNLVPTDPPLGYRAKIITTLARINDAWAPALAPLPRQQFVPPDAPAPPVSSGTGVGSILVAGLHAILTPVIKSPTERRW